MTTSPHPSSRWAVPTHPARPVQVALYARVSSEQQVFASTIGSQLAALRERASADQVLIEPEHEFIDDGYSGATLVRPALERLRDLAAGGELERLYVHSPDRLARKYAYQVLLVDEFHRAGVEVMFLNRPLGQTPEDDLLLQVQGMVAEYERAKILERSRRGKRYAARTGTVSVLCGAPYGYRYVGKHEGAGQARYEIRFEEARVVRQVFDWVGRERVSIGEVCRRLTHAGVRTRSGKTTWDRTTIWGMLKNPAYMGAAAFGKTRSGAFQPRLRAQRGRALRPRRAVTTVAVPPDEWITVPVPALVSAGLFAAVQDQLRENRRHARQSQRGARYLLQGLLCCAGCGYAFYGKAISPSAAKHHPRAYAYYRCLGADAYRFGGQRLCHNPQVRTDLLDEAVWQEVRQLLADPQRLLAEYERRRQQTATDPHQADLASLETQLTKLRQGIGRLIDSYAEGLIEKRDFEPRITRFKERVSALEAQAQDLRAEAELQHDLQLLIGHLDDFAATVKGRLEHVDWHTQRALIRALVKRVEIAEGEVNVVFRIGPGPIIPDRTLSLLPDCGRSPLPPACECRPPRSATGC